MGVILDKAVRWKPDIDDRRKKAYIPYKKLYSLLTRNSPLPVRLEKLLYIAFVRPIITYGSQLWAGAASSHLKILQVVQNTYLRLIYKKKGERISNKKLHVLADLPQIKEVIIT